MIGIRYRSLNFKELHGWKTDDVGAALRPFADCASALQSYCSRADAPSDLLKTLTFLSCKAAETLRTGYTAEDTRFFFETHFTACAMEHHGGTGLLTGYYQPVLEASRVATDRFAVPIYRRPDDLVNGVCDEQRGGVGSRLTHMRKIESGLAPFAERADIEQGALDGAGLELFYLADAVDAFFLHVQGSGLLLLTDGTEVCVGYDGKNGHPYTSIGRYIVDRGFMPQNAVTLASLKDWLKADAERARQTMWQNKSFIFFKELPLMQNRSPFGVHEIPLTPGRSLAVDSSIHQIGLPVFVSAPTLNLSRLHRGPFQRLLIAQDVGSAITGYERGDLFCGTGDIAGVQAGSTNHTCNFFPLLPKNYIF